MHQEITDSLVDAQSSAEERPRTEAEGRLSELQKKRLLVLHLLGQEEMFQEITDSLVDAQSSAEKWSGTEAEGRLSDLQKKRLLALHLHGQEEMLNQEITDLLPGDEEGVALQAIEFWSSICRKEIRYKGSMPGDSDTHSRRLIQKALPSLLPMLLKTLFKQDEDQDKKDDILNLAAAGGTCLGLVAKTVGDAVIPLVKPFVLENISKPDWRYLEAAKHAYGSYLEGVTVEKLSEIDDLDLEYLLTAMRDQNRHVKSTAARTLSRIFQLDPPPATVISPKHHNIIMAVLPEIVKESPGVLTPMIGVLRISMKKLWVTDDDETERFDRANDALICLQVIFQKLGSTDETADSTIKAAAAEIMPVLLNIFDIKSPTVHEKAKVSTVREKAFLAVGAIAYAIGPAFEEYTKRFLRYLVAGFKDQRVCSVCLGVFGDICRALDYKVLPFSHDIMPRLVKLLSSVDVSVKPPVFSCFGDLALAIGSESERLVPYVVPLMEEAAKIVDEETVEYGNQLKQSIFEAYSGLLQGCRSSKAEIMEPHVPHLLKFIEAVVKDAESVLKAAVVVLGDLADALGPNVKKFEKQVAFCREFLGECLKSEDKQLKETATWTLRMMGPVRVFSKCGTQDQKDDIGNLPVAGVEPFVLKNISKHWRSCEAVKYAYGSYPEGLSDEQRSQRVGSDLVYLLQEARGENSGEKDRAVWTLSRLFELLHNPATYTSEISLNLTMLIEVLECYMYKDVCRFPHFRKKVCVAVYHLAKGYGKKKSPVLEPDHYPHIIRCLAAAGQSADPELASAAYKAVNELVKYSNPDGSSQMILPLLKVVWTKLIIGPLKSSVDAEPFALSSLDAEPFALIGPLKSSVDAEPLALSSVDAEPFALICGCLQDIIQKLSSTSKTKLIVVENEYNIAWCLLKVFAFGIPTVYEKAMLATDAFACAIGIEFRKYMKRFYEYLEMGLKDRVQCSISVKVVGNICRVLDYELLPFCGSIMERLTSLYYEVPVKPLVFSCFGDMALAIGLHFERYVSCAVHMMETAANELAHIKNVNDKTMVEYGKRLKLSIFKAYSGILQGCKKSKAEIMVPYAPKLLKFIKVVARDPNRDLSLLKAAVALLRDLAVALGPNAEVIKDSAFCSEFLRECLNSGNKQLKETATRTIKMTVHVLSIYRTQDEDQDQKDDIWNLPVAGADQDQKDDIWNLPVAGAEDADILFVKPFVLKPIVKPFTLKNISKFDSEQQSKKFESELEDLRIAMFYDERRLVEYSAHILISGILMLETSCCFFVIAPKLKEIMAVFLEIIKDSPGVAEEVCDVICRLAEWCGCSETKHAIFEVEDQIVRLLLKVFDFGSPTVYVKAMGATGTFACAIGPEFCKRLPQFHGFLQKGLVYVEDNSVCSASIRVVGDLCCALDYKILPSSSVIMTLLNDYLCCPDLDRSFKPLIFSCFGNMALAIGSHFESGVPYVMYVMETAANEFAQTEDVNDKATVEYGKQLKQGIFKAYSGILLGCKRSNAEIMVPYVPEILDFIVGKDDANRDESVLQAAVAVLGDLAVALGPKVKEEKFKKQLAFCMEFLGECLKSEDKQLKETATWTHAVLGSKQLKETATWT